MVAKRGIQRSLGSRTFDIANITFLLLFAFITLYPFYYVLIVSISDGRYVVIGAIKHLPRGINLESYNVVLNKPIVPISYRNTIMYTVFGTFINVLMSAICAYPLSRKSFYGRKFFTGMIVFTMFFQGGLIPVYLTVKTLGMLNTIWAIVLPAAIGTYYMIIMRTFFQGIPDSIQDSARIDGANDILIFFRIILPMSIPVIATMTLFYAVQHWNSFFPALIYLPNPDLHPLQLILRKFLILPPEFEDLEGIEAIAQIFRNRYVVIMIGTLPILAVYPFLQGYFIKGVMMGAIKG